MNYKDELYHYGVIGMKWGIRRYQPYSVKPRGSGKGGREIGEAARYRVRRGGQAIVNATKKGAKAITYPVRKAVNNKITSIKDNRAIRQDTEDRRKAANNVQLLSDAEIKQRIDRYKSEQELKRLTMNSVDPGRAYVNSIMSDVGKKVLTTALTGAAIYGAKWLIDRNYDKSELAKSVYYGGAQKKK